MQAWLCARLLATFAIATNIQYTSRRVNELIVCKHYKDTLVSELTKRCVTNRTPRPLPRGRGRERGLALAIATMMPLPHSFDVSHRSYSRTAVENERTVLTVRITYLMKFIKTCFSSRSGAVLPPLWIFPSSQAMFVASVRMVCIPSVSSFTSPFPAP